MATIVLSAAGMALGGSLGGSVLGLSTAVIGRAVGATLGRVIDNRLMGAGSEPVETGRIDRFRLMGASDGAPVAQVYGRMRVGGQVIWATRFLEDRTTSGGGKGSPRPTTISYSYTISLAVALCEGEITHVGRIWADGQEISPDDLNMRVYTGAEDQLPDPKMEAVEGAGNVPAYRGIAYVVFEDLDLSRFGNRVPQFSFEVSRPSQPDAAPEVTDIARLVPGVALVPGTGEYALATEPVYARAGVGETAPINVNSASGQPDFVASMDALEGELPACGSVSMVVSWFGDDLCCGDCAIAPKVEQAASDPVEMPWVVSGITRASAGLVPRDGDDRPVYGGTPADASVMQAIGDLTARGKSVVFYPFLLMGQMQGNTLPDPWSGAVGQPHLPWRGRITTSLAPGVAGSPDQTAAAEAEVAAFFGTAAPGDFTVTGTSVSYTGPAEASYRRFILHYAHLCAAAGGVDAFCIGSEMRSLTQIRGAGGSFPAVAALRQLAADVRAILGPGVKIGYAADWSEYHGYQPAGTGDKLFHLDPLWADPEIDFIGIDNYMPLSDWRDGQDHADAGWESIYNLDYLRANVEGGELYDWFYHSEEARAAQIRTPIVDADGEPWVWRTKDIRGWWENHHHDRVGGVRAALPTDWVPGSKPIWFTEIGCAAVEKGTNQPNKFLDPKSSESTLPRHSNGQRDELIQNQYLRALIGHYTDPANNPTHAGTGVQMIDMGRTHVWAWDARPYPAFPGNAALWSDGENWSRGHWISGRTSIRTLAGVVDEICARSGVTGADVSRLHGIVRGYAVTDVDTARAALQPLMLAHGFDVIERDGVLSFVSRGLEDPVEVDAGKAVLVDPDQPTVDRSRAPAAELAGRVRLLHVDPDSDYAARATEAIFPDEATFAVSQSELPMALIGSEARAITERWLSEARVARDRVQLALPPSRSDIGAGDVIRLDGADYRVDRAEISEHKMLDAVRIEPALYDRRLSGADSFGLSSFAVPVPVEGLFMDLPLLRGDEVPHAPHFAAFSDPWPGSVALYSAPADYDYALNTVSPSTSVVGITETAIVPAQPGLFDRGPALRVRLVTGALGSVSAEDVIAGANVAVIGNGTPDNWEVIQFAEAVLVAEDTYELRMRLRGQAGSDGIALTGWPVGSLVVLMNATPRQIALAASARGVTRHFRWGPASRPIDHASFRHAEYAFSGNGLRPYRVGHLRAGGGAEPVLSWVRRSRVDGDGWEGFEIPLGEDIELYRVQVIEAGTVLREEIVTSPGFTYTSAMQAADGNPGLYRIEVAQISAQFGPGPAVGLDLAA
ncbi:host specificity protein [Loktanella sp. IMCC34160]|uniref:baseplate multidomain protein megatron n=1 Tax=Loktanella sp. IMCC34160 TaxID=2510646 RepID=UPI00101C6AED|nr:glycoside hydrolase/phage tail family protein [Loktanella sp. IMCC34160]RYG91932.1 host specificity protein [Loktanella sp. IMCC34160]